MPEFRLQCNCGADEYIVIDSIDWGADTHSFEDTLSIKSMCSGETLLDRLKDAFTILWRGRLCYSEVLLTRESTEQLRVKLVEILERPVGG